jgi:hypothetical protein
VSVTLGGQQFDMSASTISEVEANMANIRRERGIADDLRVRNAEALGAARQAADPAEREARVVKLQAELERLGQADQKDVDAAVKALAEAKALRDTLQKGVDTERTNYTVAKGQKEDAEARLKKVETLKGKCPLCGHKMTAPERDAMVTEIQNDGETAAANMELATARGQEAKKKLDAAASAFTAAESKLPEIKAKALEAEGYRVELAALRQRAAENRDAVQVGKLEERAAELAAQVAALDARIELGAQVLKAKQDYDLAAGLYADRPALEAEIETWDRAQKLLGPGGPVQKLAASGFDLEEVNRHVAALLPGGKVYADNWEISYWDEPRGNRPVEACSRSERFRLGAAFAAALSKAAGIGLLVLDECELLVGPPRVDFLNWLASLAPEFNRILVMASRESPEGLASAKDFTFFWVQDGRAELAVAPQEVTA